MKTLVSEHFPQWAVCYAAYGDWDNLEEGEKTMIDAWLDENGLCDLIDVSDEVSFSAFPDFGMPCEVVTATFIMRDKE